jgi:hypothetical protein
VCSGACPVADSGAVTQVRIQELNIGGSDYLSVRNFSPGCPADLGDLDFVGLDSTFNADIRLPTRVILPGEVVYVFEKFNGNLPSDINLGANLNFSGQHGGWAMLCERPCTTTSAPKVVDFLAFQAGSAPPTYPPPVAFDSPMTGITTANEATQSFMRAATNGVAPNFTRFDWALGPRTR